MESENPNGDNDYRARLTANELNRLENNSLCTLKFTKDSDEEESSDRFEQPNTTPDPSSTPRESIRFKSAFDILRGKIRDKTLSSEDLLTLNQNPNLNQLSQPECSEVIACFIQSIEQAANDPEKQKKLIKELVKFYYSTLMLHSVSCIRTMHTRISQLQNSGHMSAEEFLLFYQPEYSETVQQLRSRNANQYYRKQLKDLNSMSSLKFEEDDESTETITRL